MAQINIKVDEELKEKASKIFSELGLDLTTGIRMFLSQVVLRNEIPFDVTLRKTSYDEAMEDVKAGRVKSFDSVDELFEDLDSDEE